MTSQFPTTPDMLVSDSPFDAILTGIPYCRGLPRQRARLRSNGALTRVEGDGQLGYVEFDLNGPVGDIVRQPFQDLYSLIRLLDVKEAQHVALLRKLRETHNAVESIPDMGPIRRFLRKRAGKPVDVVGLNMAMRELGDEHALLHDSYDEINEATQNVALYLVLMVDGSMSADDYLKYREDFHINRWISCLQF